MKLMKLVPTKTAANYDTAKVPPVHLDCDNACNVCVEIMGIYNGWALHIRCPQCESAWYICNRCTTTKKKMLEKGTIMRHQSVFGHNKRKAKAAEPVVTVDVAPLFPIETEQSTSVDETNGAEEESTNDMNFSLSSTDDMDASAPLTGDSFTESVFDLEVARRLRWIDCRDGYDTGHDHNLTSRDFFHYCHQSGNFGGGMGYLVKRSTLQSKFEPNEYNSICMAEKHIRLQMKIAKLAYALSKNERQVLAEVLNGAWQVGCEDGYACCKGVINDEVNELYSNNKLGIIKSDHVERNSALFKQEMVVRGAYAHSPRIPKDANDIRKFYTEYTHSIVQNLPFPQVRKEGPNHAYVSVVDCIRDFLSHHCGQKIASIPSPEETGVMSYCTESPAARAILSNAQEMNKSVACFLILWGDDADANAFTKMGRAQFHVDTVTIGTVKEDGQSFRNTYPLAIGKKGDCHESIQAKIKKELALLKAGQVEPFYVGGHKKKVEIHFELLATLQDQPERRGANHLMAGNGQYTARWGVSADHCALYSVLRSCSKCLKTMERRFEEAQWALAIPKCKDCLNWDVLQESALAKSSLPKNYPAIHGAGAPDRTVLNDNSRYLKPFRITYSGLKRGVQLAHDHFCDERWNQQECEAYLKVEGLDHKTIASAMDHAVNAASLLFADSDADRDLIRKQQKRDPASFERMPYPSLWTRDGIELNSHLDVIMHLLFLGVVKALIHKIQEWLTELHSNTSFVRENARNLDGFKTMSIDWLLVLPYTGGKLGTWVSENYLGFSRIALWFYQNIGEAAVVNTNEPPVGLRQIRWLAKHNKYWLKARGLATDGNAKDLKLRVAEFMSLEEIPQPLPIPERKPEHVEEAVSAVTNLLEAVMLSKVVEETIQKTDYAVRIFLSKFDILDNSVRKKEKPSVVRGYNFCCLINLPDAMRTYGPLRHLWEGGMRGEGFLRIMKPLMNQGMRQNWAANLLTNVLRLKSMDSILGGCSEKESMSVPSAPTALKDRSTKFHKYTSRQEVIDLLQERRRASKAPVSVVIAYLGHGQKPKIYAVAGNYETVLEIELAERTQPHRKFGLTYFKFHFKSTDEMDWTNTICPQMDPKTALLGFGLLLPLLDNNNTEEARMFALISSNWKTLSESTKMLALVEE